MKQIIAVFSTLMLTSQLMGCAQPTSGPGWTLLSNGLGGPVSASDSASEGSSQSHADDMVSLHTPTVANKTLSAMALERATGLKPVPSRLVKFD